MPFKRFALAITVLVGVQTTLAAADRPGAQKAYLQGAALEKSRQYPQAIAAYEEALALDPTYAWSYKEIGNCHYYQGQYSEALRNYDQYLAQHPEDQRTAAFARALRNKLNSGPGPATGAQAPVQPQPRRPTFTFGLDAGEVYNSNADTKMFITGGSSLVTVSGPDTSAAVLAGLQLGYFVAPQVEFFARLGLGPYREADFTLSNVPGLTASLKMSEISGLLGGRYWFQNGKHAFGLGLAAGLGSISGTFNQSYTASSFFNGGYSMSGSTFLFEPSGCYDYLFNPHWSMRLALGYRSAKFSTLTAGSGTGIYANTTFKNPAVYGNGSQASFDDSGVFVNLGLYWR